jgi:two-component system heavy metal sensor histidine kinase CusS
MHSWLAPDGARFSGTHGVAAVANGSPVRFYLSVDRRRDAGLLAGFIKATALALPLLLAIVALGAGLIARTGLAPLRRFNRLAASIGTQSLDKRLSVLGLPGELEEMAKEFNSMLARIDQGYRQLEGFAGDLAHEMRTPVGTLLGRTQVALSQTRTVAQLREVLEGNVEELNRLAALISDMLFIARADHDAAPLEPVPVDLAREASSVAAYLSLVAEERNIVLHVSGTAPPLMADRLLVQRAITNVVSNAVRHASDRSTISIRIESSAQGTTLSVTNEGEVITPEHLERIFERFYRIDQGRARRDGGSGLGLAIVRSILKLHRGSVSAVSEGGRTTFTLAFPAMTARGPAA